MRRKTLSFILSICLVLSLFPGVSYGTEGTSTAPGSGAFSDIQGHWAREAIQKAVTDGYVKGYPDGKFLPERPVSRAEFVSMVNNALQLRSENKVKLVFSDVKDSDWFSAEVAKAGYVRYIKGTSATTFSPDQVITRQEAALMLSRFLPKEGMKEKTALGVFPDRGNISDWAEEGMAVTVNKGYMNGHANGTLAPLGTLTRAEAVTLIGQILAKETIVREDVFVKESGDILRDNIYVGDITIDEEVGEGDATLQNLSALSVVYVNGGGSHTVTMENSLIIRLVVTKEGTQVRVLAADGTTIYTSILFNNNMLVDEQGEDAQPDGETFEDIVVVQGAVTSEQAQQIAAAISDQVQSGNPVTPQQVTQAVQSVLTNSTTRTDESGTIVVEVPPTPRPNTGGGNTNQLASVSVGGETDYITATVAALAAPAAATVTYQWQRSQTADGEYANILNATGAAYTITQEDLGQFLKVTATATGTYTGTRTSAAAGPIGFAGGSGTVEDPYQIGNWFHLDNMRYLLDSNYLLIAQLTSQTVENASLSVHASALAPVSEGYAETVGDKEGGWAPVGQFTEVEVSALDFDFRTSDMAEELSYFTGTFDGGGKMIKDLYISRPDVNELEDAEAFDYACGLFGVLYTAEVGNVRLRDPYVEGTDYVGALAGYSWESSVTGVTSISSAIPTAVQASGLSSGIFGETRVGGIVGRNDVSLIENCTNSVPVRGLQYVGGIAGSNYAESMIELASIHPSDGALEARIQGCVNEGDILGWAFTGGIAGGNGYSQEVEATEYTYDRNSPATIHQCANYGYVEADTSMIALTDAPMKFGGIAGGSSGTISESFNLNTVGGECFAAGGIVGSTNGTVENNYNEGLVTGVDYYGGIVGYAREAAICFNYNTGDFSNYYGLGSLNVSLPYQICGYDEGLDDGTYEASLFTANFYLEEMEPKSLVQASGDEVEGIYSVKAEELRNPLNFKEGQVEIRGDDLPEWDFQAVWTANLQDNEGYPFLRWQWSDDYSPIPLEIEMPVPDVITLGQTLCEATLEGGSVAVDGVEVPGTFEYWGEYHTPEEDTPALDGMTAHVLFRPADEATYDTFAGTVFVAVDAPYLLGEPNDTAETATPLVLGEVQQNHWITPETDVDWFSFTAEAGQLYRISTLNLHPDGEDNIWMDTYLYLYDSDGIGILGENDDYIDLDSSVLWTCPESGTYYSMVVHYDYDDGSITADSVGRYDIVVREEGENTAIVNGGFETGDLEGWDVGRSGQYPFVQSAVARSGDYAAHLSDGADGMYPAGNTYLDYTTSRLVQTFTIMPGEDHPMVSFYYSITDTDEGNDRLVAWLYYPNQDYTESIGEWYESTGGWRQASHIIMDPAVDLVELHIQSATTNDLGTNNYYVDDVAVEYLTEDVLLQNEPDDGTVTATPITLGTPVTNWIYPYDDGDGYQIVLEEGEYYEVRTQELLPGEKPDTPFLTTFIRVSREDEAPDGQDSSYARWSDGGANEAYLIFQAPATDTYYIGVRADHPDWDEGCFGRYTLSISIASPPPLL